MDFNATYEAAMAEGKAVDVEARRRFDAVNADPMLTQAGKAPKLAEVDAWRVKQVDALQHKMALEMAGEKGSLRVDIDSGRADLAKAERKRLSDYPAAALLLAERELAVLPSAELVQRVEAARDPLERDVLARLALVEAQRREEGDVTARQAVFALKPMTVSAEEIAIRDMERTLAQLERDGDKMLDALDRRSVARQMHAKGMIADPSLFEMPR